MTSEGADTREAGSSPKGSRPFTANGRLFRLAAEAERIRLAHLFDPYVAVHASRIEALPHQITAVYGEMLPRQPLRFLLADDPGAGKTIMAGLLIRELMLRGDLERCLVVAPGSLVEQWQDELESKFGLAFDLLTRERIEAAGTGGNPFTESSHLIARLDVLSRSEDLRRRLEAAKEWDLVVCDEAHRMAASFFGTEVRYTKRYRLGQLLGTRCRHFLLMTATPHNGKEEDFRLFMALLDPDRFEGRFRSGTSWGDGTHRGDSTSWGDGASRVGGAHRRDSAPRGDGAFQPGRAHQEDSAFRGDGASPGNAGDLLRRLTKEELLRFDGRPLFPERRAHTVRYALSGGEAALYAAVTDYVREEMDRAERLAARDEKRRRNVGFALQILQRRLASSPAAVHESLRRRRERLEARLAHLLAGAGRDTGRTGREAVRTEQDAIRGAGRGAVRTGGDPLRAGRDPHDYRPAAPPADSTPAADFDPDDLEEAAQEDVDAIEARVLGHATTAETVAEFETEIDALKRLEDRARALRRDGTDTKWLELASLLDHPLMTDAGGRRRKLIVFTEPRDTLEYLAGRIRTRLGRDEAVVVIHGGVGRADRRKAVEAFMHDPDVVVMVANDAAGEGVNLQRAHLMVNYDLPWNPNRLEQRFGRIHRIGQTEVCHLWNLVAKDTREGEVYGRLLEKLETARSALGGRVYDVLGRLFEGAGMRDLLMDAVRYGERLEVRARLFERVDGTADRERLLALLEDRALARDHLGAAAVGRIREEMERAEARRLQPHYIESFFLQAFRHLGGAVHRREAGRYEITRVPGPIRMREPRAACAGPVLDRYERICFEKSKIAGAGPNSGSGMGANPGSGPDMDVNLSSGPGSGPDSSSNPNPGRSAAPRSGSDTGSGMGANPDSGSSAVPPAAVCLSPGHPLLDATVDLVLERYRGVLAEGAVLVDESDEGETIRALFHVEIAVRDGHERRPGHPRIVSRQIRFVEVDAGGDVGADVDTAADPGANVDPDVDTNIDTDADADADADLDTDTDTEADTNANTDAGHTDAGHADAEPGARNARDAGPAPYLDYRPIEDDERASIAARLETDRLDGPSQPGQPDRPDQPGRNLEDVAMTYARTHLASNQAGEVRARRLPEIDRVEAEVTARLKREIVFWDNRALRLRDDERAGKAAGPVSAARAVARADELADRLARRRAELARERDLTPLPPVVRGRALVVPIGLLRRAAASGTAGWLGVRETTPAGRAEVERLAMEAVMAAERALGHEPRDVSAAKVGYDIESREAKTGRLRFIEVKGRAGDADTVTVTHQEIRTALNKPDAFILAIVRVRDGYVSGPRYLHRPFRAEPDFDAVSVTYNLRELLARAEVPR